MVAISYISLGLVAISTAVVAAPSAVDIDNKFFSHIHTHAKHTVGHSHSPHNHAHNHAHNHSKRSTTCSFPSNDGLVKVTPGSTNGGWALSPDTACTAGSWCPYACPSGQLMAQWDPSATSYTYPQSQYGGLYCNDNGQVSKGFSDKPYCYDGTGTVSAVSSAGNVAFCQTVLPGNEAMLIPTEVTSGSTTLAVPDSSYWAGTAAHYYINPPGVSTDDGCVWGSTSNPWGNWSPYVAGANTDSSGTTFLKVGWNPVYLENSSPYKNTLPSWGVNITCPDGGCTGLPCGINPSVHGVNQCYNQATGAGGGNFCVVGVQSGKSATIEVFSSGSSSSNAKVAAAANAASSPSSSSEYSSSDAASTPTVELTASSASPASTTSTSSTSTSSTASSSSSDSSISSTSSTSSTSSDTSSSSSAYVDPTTSAVYTSWEPLTSSTEVSSNVNTDTSSEVLPTSTEVPVSSSTAVQPSSTEVTVESSSTEAAMTSTSIPVSSTIQAPYAGSSFAASSAEASSVSAIVSSLSETTIGELTTSSDAPFSTSVIIVTTTVVPSSTMAFNYSSTPTYTSDNGTFTVSPSSTAALTSLSSSIQPTNGTTLVLSTTTTPTASSSTFNSVSTISSVSRGAQYLNLEQSSTTSSTLTSASTTPTQSASSNSSNTSSGNVSAGLTLHTPGTVYIAAVVLGAVLVLA
ncbi:hypothetical protein V1515DRAFT_574084 [Lipomyces mesembrius]